MMTAPVESPSHAVGTVLEGPERVVTPERLRWYGNGLLSSAADQLVEVGSNIHTDAEYALTQGFTFAVADGMLSTNYLSMMLTRAFGTAYIENGELRTRFVKPVPVGVQLKARGRVTSAEPVGESATRYELDVWTEDADGVTFVVGSASIVTG
jgi:hypothetical protein